MKVLALDYGLARTGVAVSDSTGTLARPLTVVQKAGTAAGMRVLLDRIAEQQPELVVVGLPLTLRGSRASRRATLVSWAASMPGSRRDVRRALHHDAGGGAPPARSTVTMRWPPPPARGIRHGSPVDRWPSWWRPSLAYEGVRRVCRLLEPAAAWL
jgi:hypothetical protein